MTRYCVALLLLSSPLSAFAAPMKVVAECARDAYGDAEGYEVSVATNMSGRSMATLFVVDPAGKRAVRKYPVTYLPADSERPGSLPSYAGRDFLLRFQVTGRPRRDGLVRASLSTRDENQFPVEELLLCRRR